jgi:hypothetical protein
LSREHVRLDCQKANAQRRGFFGETEHFLALMLWYVCFWSC